MPVAKEQIRQIIADNNISSVADVYTLLRDGFKDILQDISLQFDKYIRTTFVADLDNVQLFPEYKSLDILDLIAK